MKRKLFASLFLTLSLAAGVAHAGSGSTILGGALGGAAGAAIGESVGGRNGAVIGGAIGGATGAAIGHDYGRKPETRYVYKKKRHGHHKRWHRHH
ncbi:outer membrane protein with glycine zipper [Crenobacter luteus]|uniref:Glycine zipper domain-containing protein n=1 Tax=Crenobacter luteus TaxID=1452487 RepID=A0A163D4W8_9NEIS|nr:glycine zipper domain-containing protein [Crenobacter luteus]KZE33866.1 hypothetical protein AVW16_07310 [Crenobacter luteus]TCP13873.1 outer membrane protein with glycine zipper [Crenobacter luteus]